MNPFVISQKRNGNFKTLGGEGLDTHNKEAILRKGKRQKASSQAKFKMHL